MLKRTCDLHAQAASLGHDHSEALLYLQGTASRTPGRLDLLEVKLDKVLAETSVLKALSLSESATLEVNGKALRHLVREQAKLLPSPRDPRKMGVSSSSSTPHSKEPLSDSPPLLTWVERIDEPSSALVLDEGVSSSDSKHFVIPSAVERSTLVEVLARTTSASTSASSSETSPLVVESASLPLIGRRAAESEARAVVSSRLAAAEQVLSHEFVQVGGQRPVSELVTSGGSQSHQGHGADTLLGPIGEQAPSSSTGLVSRLVYTPLPSEEPGTSSWSYDEAAATEAVRASYRMAEAAQSVAHADWAMAALLHKRLHARLDDLNKRHPGSSGVGAEAVPMGQDAHGSVGEESPIILTPAMLDAARRGPTPLHDVLEKGPISGIATTGALRDSMPRHWPTTQCTTPAVTNTSLPRVDVPSSTPQGRPTESPQELVKGLTASSEEPTLLKRFCDLLLAMGGQM